MYKLPYGEGELSFTLPSSWEVELFETDFTAQEISARHDIRSKIKTALHNPLGTGLKSDFTSKDSVAVVISDLTRPVPNTALLSVLLPELEDRGVSRENIKILVAAGLHRKLKHRDLIRLAGKKLVERYNFDCHDARDSANLKKLGTTSRGTPLLINRDFLSADYRITTGLIDVHQFAGFAGGCKSITIGLGGSETICANHRLLEDDRARPGEYDNNPLRQDIEEVLEHLEVHFSLNVILDEKNRVSQILAGDITRTHAAGREIIMDRVKLKTNRKFEVAIISPGGYPKDIDLYQAQKALEPIRPLLKKGGTVILVAQCREGFGDRGFQKLISQADTPQCLINDFTASEFQVGPHKAYLYAKFLKDYKLLLVSPDLDPVLQQELPFKIYNSISGAVRAVKETGIDGAAQKPRVAVIPKASSIIAEVIKEKGQ